MARLLSALLEIIDKIPLLLLGIVAVFMMLAPFSPEPHLFEKSRMLVNGELTKPIDIFDLFWHSFWMLLFIIRLLRYKHSAIVEK